MLNEKIKKLRIANNLTQTDLGKELGVSKQCISNWENDNVQPSVEMLMRIARYFHVTPDYLLDFRPETKISAEGLTEEEITHIQWLVKALALKKEGTE